MFALYLFPFYSQGLQTELLIRVGGSEKLLFGGSQHLPELCEYQSLNCGLAGADLE